MRNSSVKVFIVFTALIILLACAIPGQNSVGSSDLEKTQIALGVQATSLALQREEQAADTPAQEEEETGGEVEVTQNETAPTYTPFPTYTPYPTQEQPTDAPLPTETPSLSMEDRIRQSNVLIFEDIWGDPVLAGDKRVSQAVNMVGFSGGRVINVGDAMGDFKSHLLSGTYWDLIIVSAEVRSGIQGEFWEYIMDHLNRDTAMIAEVWYLDDTNLGKIAPVLSSCGIKLQSDWVRNPGDNELDYSILNLDSTHPIFNTPNSGISLVTPNIYWMFDAGDLIKLGTGGDAHILAGIYYSHKSDYGVIADCMSGKVIFQTFSTHDYRRDQTVPLWVNYINYTLSNHYLALDGQ